MSEINGFKANLLIKWVDTLNPKLLTKIERIVYVLPSIDESHEDTIVIVDRDPKRRTAPFIVKPLSEYLTAIATHQAFLTEDDPYQKDFPPEFTPILGEDADARDKRREKYTERNNRYNAIEPIIAPNALEVYLFGKKSERAKLLQSAAINANEKVKTVREWVLRYLRDGMTKNALLTDDSNLGAPGQHRSSPNKLGRPHRLNVTGEVKEPIGVNLTADDRANFRFCIEEIYNKAKKNGRKNAEGKPFRLEDAFTELLLIFYPLSEEEKQKIISNNAGAEPEVQRRENRVSFDQFKDYYYNDYLNQEGGYETSQKERKGQKAWNTELRPLLGNLTEDSYSVGSQYQIDATIGDVYLKSALDPNRIIGRPVIYLISDTFSHMIVSYCVTLEGPSWLGATGAFENLALPKPLLGQFYGFPRPLLELEWPCVGFPISLVADNAEMSSENAKSLMEYLHVLDEIYLPPFRPDWKGIVESDFKTLNNEVIEWMPGYVYRPGERGTNDYRLDSRMTLRTFNHLMINYILKHNRVNKLENYPMDEHMIKNEVRPYPLTIWHHEMRYRRGKERSYTYDMVRKALLPRYRVNVTKLGIHRKGLYFTCATAEKENWKGRARDRGGWTITVAIDPRDPKVMFLCDKDLKIVEPCWLEAGSLRFGQFTWYEVMDFFTRDGVLDAKEEDELLDYNIQYARTRAEIIASEKPIDVSGMSKREATSGINENRKTEKEYERFKSAIKPEDSNPNDTNTAAPTQPAKTDTTTAFDVDFLKKTRKGKSDE